jgi:Holliday junction resolvase RusA-like endonuclease
MQPDLFDGLRAAESIASAELAETAGAHTVCRRVITFEVLGTPAPKGSVRPIVVKGRAMLTPSHGKEGQRRLKSWESAVREAAVAAVGDATAPPFVGVPLVLEAEFRIARPAGHWGAKGLKPSAPRFPATKPDVDKLYRLVGDVLNALVWDDDSRVVDGIVRKRYALPGNEGATITIREAT